MSEQIRCSCNRLNDPWRRYCGGCGTALGKGCLCGFPNSDTDRFCGGCGVTTVQGRASSAARKIEESERALQFHQDTSTQRIEMLLDAVATDPNT